MARAPSSGGSAVVGTSSLRRRTGAMDRRVCPLFSVVCSLDIVKRVVTVKQVAAGGGWTWAWVCEDAGARGPGGAKAYVLAPEQVTGLQEVSIEADRRCSGLSSVLCPLVSACVLRAWG